MASRYESDMTRKEKMQLEKEKLSKMNFKEKLAYIWEYYKAVIFGIIAVIFIIGTIVNIHENAKYYDLVSIAVVDYAGLQDVSPIEEDLKEALGTGDKYEKVSIDTSYSFGENLENADEIHSRDCRTEHGCSDLFTGRVRQLQQRRLFSGSVHTV